MLISTRKGGGGGGWFSCHARFCALQGRARPLRALCGLPMEAGCGACASYTRHLRRRAHSLRALWRVRWWWVRPWRVSYGGYARPLPAAEAGVPSSRSLRALWRRVAPFGGGRPMEVGFLWRRCPMEAGTAPARPIHVLCALQRRVHPLRCSMRAWLVVGVPSAGGRPVEVGVLRRRASCGGRRPMEPGVLCRRASCGGQCPMEPGAPTEAGVLCRRAPCGGGRSMEAGALWRRVRRLRIICASSGCGCALWRWAPYGGWTSYGGGRPMAVGAPPAHLIRVLCALRRRIHPLRCSMRARWWWVCPL